MAQSTRFAILLTAFCITFAVSDSALAEPSAPSFPSVPNPRSTHSGWVTDSANVLGASNVQVESLLAALNRDTGSQVAVVTMPSIGEAVPKFFATGLFNYWQIGRAGHDDGVLVLHVIDQRRLEIETGYGSEGALPDAKCAWLVQDVALPRFKAGDLAGGHLALARGVDYAIRHPEVGHDTLVQAALSGMAPPQTNSGASGLLGAEQRASIAKSISDFVDVPLIASFLFALLVWPFRSRAHVALYREPKRRPDSPRVGLIVGLILSSAWIFIALMMQSPSVHWLATAGFALTALLIGRAAVRDKARAIKRYAPRTCGKCGSTMQLLSDDDDDEHLDRGQRIEERMNAVDYDVWMCSCGEKQVEEQIVSDDALECPACSYRTEKCTREKILESATEHRTGRKQRFFQCRHCNGQRTDEISIPRKTRSSSSSSSSGGGSSFGGGRSGGGGAGGSY